MNPLLSIIIPVYKVEAYIEECLRSVLDKSADSSQYEVIIVNDGTPDRSMEIVHGIVDGLLNVKIVEQENRGLSAARMNGLKKAEGEYVWFIDSDDYLVEGGIRTALDLLSSDDETDLHIFPIKWFYPQGEKDHIDLGNDMVFQDSGKNILCQDKCPRWLVQRFIIRKSLFSNRYLIFPIGKLHEDNYFSVVLLYLAANSRIHPFPLYNYRIREGSIMTTRGIRSSYDILDQYGMMLDFYNNEVSPEDREWFKSELVTMLRESYRVNLFHFQTEEFKTFLRQNKKYICSQFRYYTKDVQIQRRLKDSILLRHPILFQSLLRAKERIKR